MQVTLWDAFQEFAEFHRTVDRMLGRTRQRVSYGYPPIDLIDTGDAFLLSAFLPGMQRDQIHLSVSGMTVTLKGSREPVVPAGARPILRERLYGNFNKSIHLPDPVREEEVNAQYTDGVLRVTLPKRLMLGPRTISVK
ncbi:Hsp20/alpha crystallin family protein [Candidatus Poribacteria bacterium]|nr:Hsp20/alpha crystallin family protein [Candidatus Poribacteria bacterium]